MNQNTTTLAKAFKNPSLLVFLFLTFALSWTEEYFIVTGGSIQNTMVTFCLMWTPGLVAIICSFIFDKKIDAVAFRRPDFKSLGLAYIVPAIGSVLILILLIITTIASFEISPVLIEKTGSISKILMMSLLMAPTLGMLLAFVSGLGEELGWRGFMHTRLLGLPSWQRYLVTGIIWSVWHWPLIMFGDYSTSDKPWINVICFSVAVTSFSFFLGWLRDRSDSVVPAALAHASHNMWILGIIPVFIKPGPLTPYFGSESGVFCALIYVGLAFWVTKKAKTV